jgi:hypothetical protein
MSDTEIINISGDVADPVVAVPEEPAVAVLRLDDAEAVGSVDGLSGFIDDEEIAKCPEDADWCGDLCISDRAFEGQSRGPAVKTKYTDGSAVTEGDGDTVVCCIEVGPGVYPKNWTVSCVELDRVLGVVLI